MNHLLYPEIIYDIPLMGKHAAQALDSRINETLADDPDLDPAMTVAIRTFNEAPKLELLLRDVTRQIVGREVEIVVVDNESTDHTKAIAKEYGAEIVTLPRGEFTYPRSMNLGMEAASHDAVFLTVAHAQLASTHTLHAGARHFGPDNQVAGVFSVALPSRDASPTSNWAGAGLALDLFKAPRRIKKASIGAMAATGAIFSKTVWRELGQFDERYESGGEDTAMARSMLVAGYDVIKEPAMTVHHSHGLGLLATAREVLHHAKTVRGPQPLKGTIQTSRQARFAKK